MAGRPHLTTDGLPENTEKAGGKLSPARPWCICRTFRSDSVETQLFGFSRVFELTHPRAL